MASERPHNNGRNDVAQKILDQATRLFAARGFVGASLHDIANAVGIRKPSLLYHFHSKDELRRSVLEQMLAHWNEVIPRILHAASSGQEQFDAIAEETLAFFSADPDRARVLLRELLDRPEEIAPLALHHVKPWASILGNYIRKGQEQGRVHADVDPDAWVAAIINLVLSSVAVHVSFAPVFPEGRRPRGDAGPQTISPRFVAELMRIARSSLFIPATDPTRSVDRTPSEDPTPTQHPES